MNRRSTFRICAILILLSPTSRLFAVERWPEEPRVGIAVDDTAAAPLVNLASLGVENATGLGLSGYMNNSGRLDSGSIHLALGWLSYAYRAAENRDNHEVGLGFPIVGGLYGGFGVRWEAARTVGVNLHVLYRPMSFLSFGIKGESLNLNPWMDWGMAIRPLAFFNNSWGSRLTLFYDGRLTHDNLYRNLAVGLRFAPMDGLEIYGHWDFRTERLVAGLNLSLSRLLVGGNVSVPTSIVTGQSAGSGRPESLRGGLQTFVSLRAMPSLAKRGNSLVVYNMAAGISDSPPAFSSIFGAPINGKGRSLYQFLRDMEMLASRKDVSAVLFDNQDFSTSFSNIVEISESLRKLKEAGKEIYFYAESMNTLQYALAASVADKIFIPPPGDIDVSGFGNTGLYFKDLLAEYGINVVNFRSHDSKTFFDYLSESGMSDAERTELQYLFDTMEDQMDSMILQGRADRLKEDLDVLHAEGFWMGARRALEAGLIDEILYREELEDRFSEQFKATSPFSSFTWSIDLDWPTTQPQSIAVIYAQGNIVRGKGRRGASIGSDSFVKAIRNARLNPSIKAIVLRVNSGGGSVLASDLIAHEVALCAQGPTAKPVVVSMGSTAGSGGYMISTPAAAILATPMTVTGSIGVIAIVPDFSGLLAKFKVGSDTVVSSESADAPSILRPLSEKEFQKIRASIADDYDSFVTLVSDSRGLSVDEVKAAAQGRIWLGRRAAALGLIDDLGGLDDAIALAVTMSGARNPRILEVTPGRFALSPRIQEFIRTLLGSGTLDSALPDQLKDVLDFYKTMQQYRQGEGLYLMPYNTEKDLGMGG